MVVDWKQARAPAPQVNQPLPRHCGKLGGLRSAKTCLSRGASLCNHGLTAFSNFLFSSVNTIQVKQLARCVHFCLIREGKEMNSPPLKKKILLHLPLQYKMSVGSTLLSSLARFLEYKCVCSITQLAYSCFHLQPPRPRAGRWRDANPLTNLIKNTTVAMLLADNSYFQSVAFKGMKRKNK